MKRRRFYCDNCGVEFEIEVEPAYSESEVESQFPRSLEWLTKVSFCPVCEKEVKG